MHKNASFLLKNAKIAQERTNCSHP